MTISVAAFIVSLNFPGATSTTVINALVQVFAALMVFMFVALMSALVLPMLFELVPMLFELVIAAHKMWLFARDRLRFRPRARHSPQSDPDALDVALARGREQLSRAARLLDPTLREATLETALDRLQRHAHTPKEVRRLARRFSLGMLRAAFCQWLPRLVNAALGGGAVGLGLMGGLKSLFDIQPPADRDSHDGRHHHPQCRRHRPRDAAPKPEIAAPVLYPPVDRRLMSCSGFAPKLALAQELRGLHKN